MYISNLKQSMLIDFTFESTKDVVRLIFLHTWRVYMYISNLKQSMLIDFTFESTKDVLRLIFLQGKGILIHSDIAERASPPGPPASGLC